MPKSRKKLNGDQPVTQAELAIHSREMSTKFGRIEGRLDGIEERLDGLDSRLDGLQKLLEENNRLLREFSSLPARVERLERSVFLQG